MNVHRPLDHLVGGAAVHQVEQRMHDLVALDTEQRRPEDPFALRVHQHLHEALSFAALPRTSHARHWHDADQRRTAAGPHLGLRPTAASRWLPSITSGVPPECNATWMRPSAFDTETPAPRTFRWICTPSRSRMCWTSLHTSGSSRAISRSAYSSTVTLEPKR